MKENRAYTEKKGFKIPESYFEDFTENLIQEIGKSEQGKKTRIITMAKPHLMLAASMIAIVIVSYTLLKTFLPGIESQYIPINQSELTEYLIEDISDQELYDALYDMDNSEIEDGAFSGLSADIIIEYLIDSDIDLDAIILNF